MHLCPSSNSKFKCQGWGCLGAIAVSPLCLCRVRQSLNYRITGVRARFTFFYHKVLCTRDKGKDSPAFQELGAPSHSQGSYEAEKHLTRAGTFCTINPHLFTTCLNSCLEMVSSYSFGASASTEVAQAHIWRPEFEEILIWEHPPPTANWLLSVLSQNGIFLRVRTAGRAGTKERALAKNTKQEGQLQELTPTAVTFCHQ